MNNRRVHFTDMDSRRSTVNLIAAISSTAELRDKSLSVPLLIVLVSWFTIIFAGFDPFGRGNGMMNIVLLMRADDGRHDSPVMKLERPFPAPDQKQNTPLQAALLRIGL